MCPNFIEMLASYIMRGESCIVAMRIGLGVIGVLFCISILWLEPVLWIGGILGRIRISTTDLSVRS
jgi:hypothetical protein